MRAQPIELTYEVELAPGEELTLPRALVQGIGPGRWVITIQPLPERSLHRDHSAFLNSFGPDDEGLYDDCAAR